MSPGRFKYILLTGEPGVGKTTLTKKICSALTERGVSVEGFYTEERRGAGGGGGREGFDVVGVRGERAELARDTGRLPAGAAAGKCRVGKYAVMVEEFERVAIPALTSVPSAVGTRLLVIDEIGKMELFSAKFRALVSQIFSSERVVLATVPLRRCDQLVETVRSHVASKVFQITRENRNTVQPDIMKHLETALQLK